MSSPSAKAAGRQPRKWSLTEDHKLRVEVEAQMNEGEVKDWCRVAAKLPGRTNKDCRKRWHNSVAGGLKKGQWSKSEDVQLGQGVQQYGQRWTLIANLVESRSADQCAKRWQQSLDPCLDRSEWLDAEDKMLMEAVQKLGRHWKDIQRQNFPGRSKNCIKNRYTVLVRRYQNQGITLPQPAGTPEPDSIYLGIDDDTMSYTSSLYDDLMPTHTQASTPDTRHSWPVEEDSFTPWNSSESVNTTCTTTDFTHIQQPPTAGFSPGSPWNWTTTSPHQPPVMHVAPPDAYAPVPYLPSLITYDAYGTVPTMLSPIPTHYAGNSSRAPTSSPTSRAGTNSPYQDPQSLSPFTRYGIQSDPPYQYQCRGADASW